MFPIPKKYRARPPLDNLDWYTLCVSSRVYQTEEMSFLDEYVVWTPASKTLVKNGDDCYVEYEPLYPGYIFVGLRRDQSPIHLENKAKEYNHSFKLLRTSSQSAAYAMSASDLASMVDAQDRNDCYIRPVAYRAGDRVKLTAGPLSGAAGIVKKCARGELVISVSAYNKDLEFTIKRDSFIFVEPYGD